MDSVSQAPRSIGSDSWRLSRETISSWPPWFSRLGDSSQSTYPPSLLTSTTFRDQTGTEVDNPWFLAHAENKNVEKIFEAINSGEYTEEVAALLETVDIEKDFLRPDR